MTHSTSFISRSSRFALVCLLLFWDPPSFTVHAHIGFELQRYLRCAQQTHIGRCVSCVPFPVDAGVRLSRAAPASKRRCTWRRWRQMHHRGDPECVLLQYFLTSTPLLRRGPSTFFPYLERSKGSSYLIYSPPAWQCSWYTFHHLPFLGRINTGISPATRASQ